MFLRTESERKTRPMEASIIDILNFIMLNLKLDIIFDSIVFIVHTVKACCDSVMFADTSRSVDSLFFRFSSHSSSGADYLVDAAASVESASGGSQTQ